MLQIEKITKPIQIIQYYGDKDILLVPDMIVSSNIDIQSITLSVHTGAIVLLDGQTDKDQNGMYKYTGTSLDPYYFDFFQNIKKIYKVTQDSNYIIYNGPKDNFNQFSTIKKNDTIILINRPAAPLPYDWYSYDKQLDPTIRFNKEIISNNLCALGTIFNDQTNELIFDLNNYASYPVVLTSEVYNGDLSNTYYVLVDMIKSPDIEYQNILQYNLEKNVDFTIDNDENLVLSQSLISNGIMGAGKLGNWKLLSSIDPNFLNNYYLLINDKVYFYNTSLQNPYTSLSQDIVKYSFTAHKDSNNIIYEKRYLIQNNITTIAGLPSSSFINSSVYIQKPGSYEIRTRLYDSNTTLLGEDTLMFSVKQLLNLPTPTPTPTPSGKKHTVAFDAGARLVIDNCDDCYKDFLTATITNMSEECRYYYEFGVYSYGNANPDEPRDTTNSDDISFTVNSGVINSGATSEQIQTLMTTGIGKIRTTLYIKVINLDNYVTSTSYMTLEKCDRDFCVVTPTPTTSKTLKSYPPRTPTKTKTPTPTQTSTTTATPTPTPTTPLIIPDAVTNLLATAGNTTVSLSWAAPTNTIIRDYEVQYSSTSGSSWITFNEGININTNVVITGLSNGTAYLFRVRATNGAGNGPYTTTASPTTPQAVPPGAPTISSATFGNQQIVLVWTPPSNNGGSAITDYAVDYSSTGGLSWITFNDGISTATSGVITGLTNGVSYLARVAAVNIAGTGAYSSSSSSVIPATVPNPVSNIIATSNNASINLSWSAPANNGGRPITDYIIQHSVDTGTSWITFSDGLSTNTSTTVTGLTNGSSYLFRVAAVNSIGNSPYFTTTTPAIPATVPSALSGLTATPGDSQVVLSWTAPSNNGNPIIDYSIRYSIDNGTSWTIINDGTSTTTTYTVTGLTNGTSVIFSVAAINGVGMANYTNSSSVVPSTPAEAPTNIVATEAAASSGLSWTAPVNTGGLPIVGYRIQRSTDNGSTWTISTTNTGSTSTTFTTTGLTNGTSYVFRVAAITGTGIIGAYSSSSNSVVPKDVPSAPPSLTATPSSGQVVLQTIRPSIQGSTLTNYVLQSSLNGSTWTTIANFFDLVASTPTSTVSGLTDGTAYFFRVAATNSVGTGGFSPTVATTPGAAPNAVTGITSSSGNTILNLSWTAPNNNGATISGYTIQKSLNNSTWTTAASTTTATSTTLSGLTNGTAYYIRIFATNSFGNGAFGYLSGTATPATTPGTVSTSTITPSNGQITINWLSGTPNGGSAITGFTVRLSSNGGSTYTDFNTNVSSTATSLLVNGLVNGTSYLIQIAAKNSIGTGPYSTYASATPASAPAAPTLVTATPGNQHASITFTTPSNNGSTITGYVAQYTTDWNLSDSAATWLPVTTNILYNVAISTVVITGLNNNTTYKFRIAAINTIGTGTYSSGSNPVIPTTSSSTNAAPMLTSALSGNSSILTTFSSPVSAFNGFATTGSSTNIVPHGVVAQYSTDNITYTNFIDGLIVASNTTQTTNNLVNGTYYHIRIAYYWTSGSNAIITYSTVGGTVPVETASLSNAPRCVATGCNSISEISRGNESLVLQTVKSSDGQDSVSYTAQISTDKISWSNITSSDPTNMASLASSRVDLNVTNLDNKQSVYYFRVKNNRSLSTAWSPVRTITNSIGLSYSYNSNSAPVASGVKTFNGTTSINLGWSAAATTGGQILNFYRINKKTGSVLINGISSWGSVNSQIAGHGNASTPSWMAGSRPVLVGNDSNFVKIFAKHSLAAAIDNSGKLYTWGNATLSSWRTDQYNNYTPTVVDLPGVATHIAFANNHASAIGIVDGSMYVWGGNTNSNIFTNTIPSNNVSYAPTKIGSNNNWVKVELSDYFGIALNNLGELWGWGDYLGNPIGYVNDSVPKKLTYGSISNQWKDIAACRIDFVAISLSGQLWAGGYNIGGLTQLGNASNWVKVFSGPNTDNWQGFIFFAINSLGELWAISTVNNNNETGVSGWVTRTLQRVGNASNWRSVVTDSGTTLAVNTNNELYGWGTNASLKIPTSSTSPMRIYPEYPWEAAAIGAAGSLGLVKMPNGSFDILTTTPLTSQSLPYSEAGSFYTIQAVYTNGNISPQSNVIM